VAVCSSKGGTESAMEGHPGPGVRLRWVHRTTGRVSTDPVSHTTDTPATHRAGDAASSAVTRSSTSARCSGEAPSPRPVVYSRSSRPALEAARAAALAAA
jgi:hypothetical protein